MTVPPVTVLPSKLRAALRKDREVAFDLECEPPPGGKKSDATDARKAIPFLATVSCHRYVGAFDMRGGTGQKVLQYLLSQKKLTIIAHNILYDIVVLHERGIFDIRDIKATIRDPMVGQFIIDEDKSSPKGLKDMVKRHLKKRMKSYEETVSRNPQAIRVLEIDKEVKFWEEMLRSFSRYRPWPEFSSPRIQKRSDLNKWVRKQMDKRWPGVEDRSKPRKKDGTFPRKYTTDEKNGRSLFKARYDDKIEESFGLEAHMKFTQWVETNYLEPLRVEKERLEQQLYQKMVEYAKDDARQTLRLWKKVCSLIRELSKKTKVAEGAPTLWQWFRLECDVRQKSLDMYAAGITLDRDHISQLKSTIDPILDGFRSEIHGVCKREVNPGSDAQMREVLFKDLGMAIPTYEIDPLTERQKPKLTDKGRAWADNHPKEWSCVDVRYPETVPDIVLDKYLSMDNEVLERFQDPVGMSILNYRTLVKLRNTYVDGLLERTAGDRRLTCYFKTIGTDTGRFSSADPNLQNIPSRKKPDIYDERIRGLGPMLRDAFIAAPGKSLIVADQSQIELRIITHFCKEAAMQRIYTEGVRHDGMFFYTGDIHSLTSAMLGIPRKLAKNVNFGFNYGMGPLKFARQIRLFLEGTYDYDLNTAREWKDGFFRTYPGIITYINRLKKAWDEGQREFRMLSGRKRHFHPQPGDYTSGGKILNAKVQGSSADLLKINIWIIENFVKPHYPSLELLLQIHDELVYEVDEKDKEECAVLIKYVMEYPWFPLRVPVLASAKHCPTWAAKDDDDRPETGVFYAETKDGDRRVWTDDDWHVYRELEDAGQIAVKSACAMLTPEQEKFCKSIVPQRLEIPA